MSEHTPGPWHVEGSAVYIGECHEYEPDGTPAWGGFLLRGCPRPEANARRIVACVNACEGMEDPADDIESLRKDIAAMELNAEQDCLVVQELGADIVALQADNARLREAEKVMETMYKALSVVHGSLFHQPGSGYIITSCEGVLHDAFRLYEKYRGTVRAALGKED